MTLQKRLKNAVSLSFSHNRDSVDVYAWDKKGRKITTIKNCFSDLFLEYFDYGTTIYDPSFYNSMDSQEVLQQFLEKAI